MKAKRFSLWRSACLPSLCYYRRRKAFPRFEVPSHPLNLHRTFNHQWLRRLAKRLPVEDVGRGRVRSEESLWRGIEGRESGSEKLGDLECFSWWQGMQERGEF